MQQENISWEALLDQFRKNFERVWSSNPKDYSLEEQSLNEEQQLVLELLMLLSTKDDYQFKSSIQLRTVIKKLNLINTEYTQVVPILFLLYTKTKIIQDAMKFQKIQEYFMTEIENFGDHVVGQLQKATVQNVHVELPKPEPGCKYPQWFYELSQISNINDIKTKTDQISRKTSTYYEQYSQFITKVFQKGKHLKIDLKLKYNSSKNRQFRDFMRVIEKIFGLTQEEQKQFGQLFRNKFINTVDKQANCNAVFGQVFVSELTQYIEQKITMKKKLNQKIGLPVNDLLRANVFFDNIQDLTSQLETFNKQIKNQGYELVAISQRTSRGTKQISIKIKIKDTIAQLQLIKTPNGEQIDLINRQYIHSLYEIRRSSFGCILGSIMLLSKYTSCRIINVAKILQNKKLTEEQSEAVKTFIYKSRK